jgi:hypothetical protein
LQWVPSNNAIFYWEVQVSGDDRFDTNPSTATSFVWWNLVHGGVSTPAYSWTSPKLPRWKPMYWRVRPRIQGDGMPLPWSSTWSLMLKPAVAVALAGICPTDCQRPTDRTRSFRLERGITRFVNGLQFPSGGSSIAAFLMDHEGIPVATLPPVIVVNNIGGDEYLDIPIEKAGEYYIEFVLTGGVRTWTIDAYEPLDVDEWAAALGK